MTTSVLPLETELFVLPAGDRNVDIMARHYGLDGRGGANFQRIGDEVGLTRERVRQIVSEVDPRHYLRSDGVPALDRVIAGIVSNLPARAADLENMLQAEGLTGKVFRLEGIIGIAALLHRPAPFRVTYLNDERFAVAPGYPRFRDIVTGARQKVRRYGMTSLAACAAGKSKSGNLRRELEFVEAVLSSESDFRWLDQRSGWFWFSDSTNNRVASRIRKMLAVANPLSIAEIRAGLARMGDPLPPNRILREFCRQLPELSVEGDMIRANAEIKVSEVLNRTEREIFQLLSRHNGCMSNSELIGLSHVVGMKRPTFYQCVTWSPIVARYNRSHYRLIGSRHAGSGAAAS